MKKTITILSLIFTTSTFAQVDIDKKMNQLEENVKNAESNFNQFKENLDISVKNFNEATRVVNELRTLKKQAVRDSKRAEQNSLVYAQVKEKYGEFIAAEEAHILKEQEAVEKLEKLLNNVRENITKRRQIISDYEIEQQKAQSEIDNWRNKQREVASVIEDIDSREEGALSEREHWSGKKDTYLGEAKKWAGEVKQTQKTFMTFRKIRD